MSCPHCAHCTDTKSPAAIAVGRIVPAIRPSLTAMLLQISAPPGALDGILRWVESLRGRRGHSTQDMTFGGHDGEWTKLWIEREPEVLGGPRRGA
jgi:hypothetical protein